MSTKTKPFYKKWQFWTIAAALVIVVATAVGIGLSANTGRGQFGMAADTGISDEDLHSVGETVEFDGGNITLTEVVRDYQPTDTRYVPDDGYEYLKATVKVENTSDQAMSYNAINWEVLGAASEAQSAADLNYAEEGAIDSGKIEPGQSLTAS